MPGAQRANVSSKSLTSGLADSNRNEDEEFIQHDFLPSGRTPWGSINLAMTSTRYLERFSPGKRCSSSGVASTTFRNCASVDTHKSCIAVLRFTRQGMLERSMLIPSRPAVPAQVARGHVTDFTLGKSLQAIDGVFARALL